MAAEPDEEQIDSRAKALDEGKFEHIEEPYQYKEPLTYEQKLQETIRMNEEHAESFM